MTKKEKTNGEIFKQAVEYIVDEYIKKGGIMHLSVFGEALKKMGEQLDKENEPKQKSKILTFDK